MCVSECWQHDYQNYRQGNLWNRSTGKLTFFVETSVRWKCGAKATLAISSIPFALALLVAVMGVSLFAKRLVLRSGFSCIRSQRLRTNATGSTGEWVWKKRTKMLQNGGCLHSLVSKRNHMLINSAKTFDKCRSAWLVLEWLVESHLCWIWFPINLPHCRFNFTWVKTCFWAAEVVLMLRPFCIASSSSWISCSISPPDSSDSLTERSLLFGLLFAFAVSLMWSKSSPYRNFACYIQMILSSALVV